MSALFGSMFGRDEDNQSHAPTLADRLFSPAAVADSAVEDVTDKLSRRATDWVVTEKDAREAAQRLRSLSPEQQKQALGKLDPTTFGRLINELPEKEREQLKPLCDTCDDPVRKLELFAACHKSKVANDAERARAQPGGKPGDPERRDAIVKDTRDEVDSEVEFLLVQAKAGKVTAEQAQSYIAAKEREHQAEMKSLNKQLGSLDGLPESLRGDYVKTQVERKLSYAALDGQVTTDEARDSVTLLSSLPAAECGRVVSMMDPACFERILGTLPAYSHRLLGPLLESCTDPERKLRLFGVYHKAAIRSDARQQRQKTKDEGVLGKQTDDQKENQRLNQRRDSILEATDAEIDEETAFLIERQKGGTALSLQDVDALIQRKEYEHRIEMKYNVNLTNDIQQGNRRQADAKPTDRVTWSEKELTQLDAGLGRLPIEHVRNNQHLSEIRRTKLDKEWDKDKKEWVDDPHVGGYASPSDHSVHITDTGASGAPWRTPKTSALAHHRADGTGREQQLSLMEEVIGHEIGHNVHQQDAALFQRFQAATGWEHLDRTTLKARLMAPAPAGQGLDATNADKKVKELDWDYAHSNPQDHFAEYYVKAIHAPESLYEQLKAKPSQELAEARKDVSRLQRRGSKTAAAHIAAAKDKARQAERDQQSREKQWAILREDVFHLRQGDVDGRVAAFTAKLPANKVQLARAFKQKAAMCMTPQQLQDLEAEFHAKL